MPATLYVLGNGFDLAHNRPTTYRDFFYVVEAIRYHLDFRPPLANIPDLKENLRPEVLNYLANVFNSGEIPDYINAITSALSFDSYPSRNLWHSFFHEKIKAKSKLDTWIDFEKEIETATKFFKQIIFSEDFRPLKMRKIYNYMGNPSFKLTDRTDAEKRLQEYAAEFSVLPGSSAIIDPLLLSYKKECILFLYQELQRYIFCLELYLRYYVMDLVFSNDSKRTPLAKILKMDTSSKFLLSFNYTDTYTRYFNPNSGIKNQHIHGKLRSAQSLTDAINKKDYLHSPLVLGFHNEEKFETSEDIQLLWFEKFFQRMLYKTGTDFFPWVERETVGCAKLNTVIYGHSLDKTDGDFIRFIFKKSSKITVYYHQETTLPQLIANLIAIFDRNTVNHYYSNEILQFKLFS